jgi:putative aldouronate transport system permease protein
MRNRRFELNYHLMLLPGMTFLLLFSFIPMFGAIIAFQNFIPARGIMGSAMVGFANFKFMFEIPDVLQVFKNTVIIAMLKILGNLLVPLVFALLLNEARGHFFKKTVQTVVYLPHFLSWVILSGIMINIFSLDGIVNKIVSMVGFEPIMFLGSNAWFRPILIGTDIWKEFGFGTIIYLAAIAGVNPGLYEAASERTRACRAAISFTQPATGFWSGYPLPPRLSFCVGGGGWAEASGAAARAAAKTPAARATRAVVDRWCMVPSP